MENDIVKGMLKGNTTDDIFNTLDDITNYNIQPVMVNKLEYVSYILIRESIVGEIITSKGSQIKVKEEDNVLKVEYRTCILNELYYEVDIYLGYHKVLKVIRNNKEVYK